MASLSGHRHIACPKSVTSHLARFRSQVLMRLKARHLSRSLQAYRYRRACGHRWTSYGCYWHCPHSMLEQGRCNGQASVRLSVPSIDSSNCGWRVCCWAPCGQKLSMASCKRRRSCDKCGQRHVDSRRRRLNTDLLEFCFLEIILQMICSYNLQISK